MTRGKWAAAVLAGLIVTANGAAAGGRSIDYLHIVANEGDSSGGHAAIRFGTRAYHFQHDRGLVRLRRDRWKSFEHRYRTLGNRSITALRIEVSPGTYEQLNDAFRLRYIAERREHRLATALRNDVALLEALAAGDGSSRERRVRGAGFFEPVSGDSAVPLGLAADLRHRIARTYGSAFLEQRRTRIRAQLARLRPEPVRFPAPGPARYANTDRLLSERHADLVTADIALDVLTTPHRLNPAVVVEEPLGSGLSAGDRSALRAAAQTITTALQQLAHSSRPDWGYPFLLGLARLATIERSLRDNRLIVLDTIPQNATHLAVDSRRRESIPDLLLEATRDRDDALGNLGEGGTVDEARWTALENAVSRVAELHDASAGTTSLRVSPTDGLPAGAGSVAVSLPAMLPDEIDGWLELARQRELEYDSALSRRYAYHLITRNCVSEIFRTIDSALANQTVGAAHPAEVSRARLGGYVHPTDRLNFIPFVSAENVRREWNVVSETTLPSFRHYHVRRMGEAEAAWRVALRESNVWTSTLYRPHAGDGYFAFFTDGAVAPRPFLGLLNLATGGLATMAGIATAPWDDGRTLGAGLSGALFSLPELLFVNLRKGSNDYVPPPRRPPTTP